MFHKSLGNEDSSEQYLTLFRGEKQLSPYKHYSTYEQQQARQGKRQEAAAVCLVWLFPIFGVYRDFSPVVVLTTAQPQQSVSVELKILMVKCTLFSIDAASRLVLQRVIYPFGKSCCKLLVKEEIMDAMQSCSMGEFQIFSLYVMNEKMKLLC